MKKNIVESLLRNIYCKCIFFNKEQEMLKKNSALTDKITSDNVRTFFKHFPNPSALFRNERFSFVDLNQYLDNCSLYFADQLVVTINL